MQEFYREIDENININRTFSIDDIIEQDKLTRFFIIGEDVSIGNILEDLDFFPPLDPSSNPPPTTGAAVAASIELVDAEHVNNANEKSINLMLEDDSQDNNIDPAAEEE